MPRPHKERGIKEPPQVQGFKPAGIPMKFLETITLSLDEYEAIRLADYENLEHKEAAQRMGISRPTFTRLIEKARQKTAAALVEAKALHIEGGNVHFRQNLMRCSDCGYVITARIQQAPPGKCPQCGNKEFENLAQNFGHGPCCGRRKGRGAGRGGQRGRR